ncbi:MAG: iron-containing alcohol dehydrogenase [Lachnospiraceae bacterium]|nr:iron-containing alcohol dehydrogenase [Lachnospiraceae bacterium]
MGTNKAYCRVYQWIFNIGMKFIKFKMPKLVEGVDSFHSIPDILDDRQKWAPMVITGPYMGKSRFVAALFEDMTERAVLFDKVTPDPTLELISEMVEFYKQNNCDSIIAIGGGSSIDAAKAMAALIARPDKSLEELAGVMKVRKETPFFIAIPTTAGTGSETTVAAVVKDEKTGRKYAINDSNLVPDYAIIDPVLTITLPPDITAYTGMDALTHAVEAYLNVYYHNAKTISLAKESVASIIEFLEEAYNNGESYEAREEMLLASNKAGAAFTRACVGNVHAIAHAIGGYYHLPHGMVNAVVLPIVLEDYGSAIYGKLAKLVDNSPEILNGSDLGEKKNINSTLAQKMKAQAFIDYVKEMNRRMNIPDHLPQINEEDIPRLAQWAEEEANPLYPVPVIYDKARFEAVLRKVAGK